MMLSQDDRTAIADLWAQYGAAFSRGDADAIAALFTSDGDMIAVDGEHLIGQAAIAGYYRRQYAGKFQGVTLQDVELASPRAISGDVGLMNASWVVHGARQTPFRVRTTFVAKRETDGWRYAAVRFAAALGAPDVQEGS